MSTPDHDHSTQDDLTIKNSQEPDNSALYERAIAVVARKQAASTSFLQRHLDIGYDDAAILIKRLESDGLIGKADGIHKRSVFITPDSTKLDGTIYENR